ncbi:MAG TPA: TetR/AcrR family transcriptional regulator C-terminal domain-containing protein [Solirubrobacteraceae bacterium]|nr:TetR/AcrR family transcriptional regulator C-terminal domain-containing protein [Solirubrobacteraceae bacterium]
MAKQKIATREPLSRTRVLRAAVALADQAGLEGFSMRGLAQELGVVPMALYKHVANKDELLDGMVDIVFSEIELPSSDLDWRSAMRLRALSTREALKRHGWAIGMMESRHPGPANLRHHDAVMGCLRGAGFPFAMAVHAYSVQDAYIYGFALQERDLAFETPDSAGEAARRRAETVGRLEDYPYLVEIAAKLPGSGYDSAVEFAWGLDLILEGLERLRQVEAKAPGD